MTSRHSQPTAGGEARRYPRSLLLPVSTSLAVLLAGASVAAPVMSSGQGEAGRLGSSLARITRLADRQVRPIARRLAQRLPADAEQLQALREPARTTQDQVKVALDELRQMSISATLDPHYLPALVAAGRAFVAASGQDPLTLTTIDPDYLGLESELARSEARSSASASAAAKLSARIGRLTKALARTRRLADRRARLLRQETAAWRKR
jgi:hypothetical protein